MRICIDVSQIVYGTGVSRYTQHLVENILKAGSDHQFLLFAGSLRQKEKLKLLVNRLPAEKKILPIPPKFLNLLWNTWHLLPLEFLTGPIDLVHTSDWAEPPVRNALKVTTIHDLAHLKNPQYASGSIRRTHRKKLFWVKKESDHIITPSHATKKDVVDLLKIKPERISVIHEATTLTKKQDFSTKEQERILKRLAIKKPYILIPGCGHPRKNIDRQIQAFKQADLPSHQLAIFGRPSEEEIKLQSANVRFTGFVDQRHIPVLYQNSALVLYTSLYEGFGLPILDAFASQTPVVTSNVSSMPEVAGNAAVQVDPEDVSSIKTGIIKAFENRQDLIQKGQQRNEQFSWQKTAEKTLEVYQKIINNHQ